MNVIHPDSACRKYWEAVMFVATFYSCNTTPLLFVVGASRTFRLVDLGIDALFVIDTILNFWFGFVDRDTKELVTDKKAIRDAYLASWKFKLNIVGTVPLAFRKLALLRMARIFMFFDQLDSIRGLLFTLNEPCFRMCRIVVVYVFLSSICGSCYSYVGQRDTGLFKELPRILYFMVQTLYTIGYGDVSPHSPGEMRLGIVLMIVGALAYALVIANMTSVLANANVLKKRYQEDIANTFEKAPNLLPDGLKNRIEACFDHLWQRQGGMLTSNLLEDLPEKLHAKTIQKRGEMLSKVPFFSSSHLTKKLAKALETRIFVPATTIVFAQEKLDQLHIVSFGSVEVSSEERIVDTLRVGDYFGDYQLFFDSRHPYTIRSGKNSVAETLVLDSTHLLSIGVVVDEDTTKSTRDAYSQRLLKYQGRRESYAASSSRIISTPLLIEEDKSLLLPAIYFVVSCASIASIPIRTIYSEQVCFLWWLDLLCDLVFVQEAIARKEFDVISLTPWPLLAFFCRQDERCLWFAILKYPHLVRGLKLSKRLESMKLSDKTITILQRSYETFFLVLFSACFWSMVSSDTLLRSIYFAIVTFSTVGYGDVVPKTLSETWFVVVAAALGATFFAGIIANITSFVHSVELSPENVQHKRAVMETFLKDNDTKKRVCEYFDHDDKRSLELLKKYLPPNIRDDIYLYATHRMVLACKLFRGTETGFLRALMLSLVPKYYARNDKVVVENETCDGMHFIAKGQVTLSRDETLLATLSKNAYFAEIGVVSGGVAEYSAECVVFSEVWFLDRIYFHEKLLPRFPDVQRRLPEMSRRIRRFTQQSREKEIKPPSLLMMSPETSTMRAWNAILLFFISWNTLWIPVKSCFVVDVDTGRLDYLGDFVFLCDIYLRARRIMFKRGDIYISSPKKIFQRYLRNGFWRHLLASLPLDLFALLSPPKQLTKTQFLFALRSIKLLRMGDVGELNSHIFGNSNRARLFRLIAALLISSHFLGSLFFAVAYHAETSCDLYRLADPKEYCENWAQDLLGTTFKTFHFPDVVLSSNSPTTFQVWSRTTGGNFWKQYVTAVYWGAATITTVGYGDVHAVSQNEMIFSIFGLCSSLVVYTYIVANLEDIVGNLDVTTTLYNQKRERVKQFCLRSYFPEDLTSAISEYYERLWQEQKGARNPLDTLPPNLRASVVLEMCGETLRKLPFFHDKFEYDLALSLSLDLYMPKDFIFHAGECALHLYLMVKGFATVDNTRVSALLGEKEFFLRILYVSSCQAQTHSQVFLLTFEKFHEIVERHGMVQDFKCALVAYEKKFEEDEQRQRASTASLPSTRLPLKVSSGRFKNLWHFLCLFGIFYFVVTAPLLVAFHPKSSSLVYVDSFFVVVSFADVYACTRANTFSRATTIGDVVVVLLSPLCLFNRYCRFIPVLGMRRVPSHFVTVRPRWLSGDMQYLGILLATIVVLCHWLACAFRGETWLISFYWALYTCSTIGYGTVRVGSISRMILGIFAMIAGAVLCDAGITAVLTAVIEHADHQSGSNSRRISCASKIECFGKETISYFDYHDRVLFNLEEKDVLSELNRTLRNRLLHRAAHTTLCDSILFGGYESGLVATMAYEMRAVVAVPGEMILSAQDEELYIFKSGKAHSVDAAGDEEFVATGMILSNVEFKQIAKRVGVPTRKLVLDVVKAKLHEYCSSYVECTVISKTVFGQSSKLLQSNVRKFTKYPEFRQQFSVKCYKNTEDCEIRAIRWRRGVAGIPIGSTRIKVSREQPEWLPLYDEGEECVGHVQIKTRVFPLERSRVASSSQLTVIADTFCHLYLLDTSSQDKVKSYIKNMRLPYSKRLDASLPKKKEKWTVRGEDDSCSETAKRGGFEAYMSEAFSKRASKGSVMMSTKKIFPTSEEPKPA